MRRRTVLRRSAAIGALAVAGCTGDGGGNGNGDGNGTGNGNGNGGGTGNGNGAGTASPTPSDGYTGIVEYGTETTNTGCDSGSAGSAEVAFDADAIRVTITGTLEAPTPCYRAAMEGVKYDTDSDEVRVTIAAKQEDVDACQQCIGAIDYETTLDMEGGLPGTVVVKHGSGSDAEEVARADSVDA